MADEEVERILSEIRERVRSEPPVTAFHVGTSATGNGSGDGAVARELDSGAATTDVALIGSYLTTTARAWDRLPPLISNRSGMLARLELQVKRRLKTATRWFTWEQVNFNAAVHHALRDMAQALLDYGRVLETVRAEIRAESAERRMALEKYQTEADRLWTESRAQRVSIEAQLTEIEVQRVADETRQRLALEAQRAEMETQRVADETKQRTALEAQRVGAEAKRIQSEARLLELREELRERDNSLQEVQRVCFKQLSLETSESAVLEERARRKVEALLKELTRRIEELEARKS